MKKFDIIAEQYYKDPNFNRSKFAREIDTTASYIRHVITKLKKNTIDQGHKPIEEKIEFNQTSKNIGNLYTESTTIKTVEQSLAAAEVDMTKWKAVRSKVGSWQVTMKLKTDTGRVDNKGNPIYIDKPKTVTMFKVQVALEKIHNMEWVDAIRSLVKTLPKMETCKKTHYIEGDYMLEIALFDTHFGMLAWGKEGQHNYDIKIAEELFLFAVKDLLEKTRAYRPSKILLPLGNDFFHINDHTNSTPQAHNLLDVDVRLIKLYTTAKKAVIKAINYCREVAPVDIVWVPGNHDPYLSYYLCDVIDHIFEDDKNVNVDKGPRTRKFYPWGKGLLIFTHGSEEPVRDLPAIVATEEPMLWANASYREVHIGHTHAKKAIQWVDIDSKAGLVIRTIPSIATVDSWHYKKGYVKSNHSAEGYLLDKKHGVIGQFTSFVDDVYNKLKG